MGEKSLAEDFAEVGRVAETMTNLVRLETDQPIIGISALMLTAACGTRSLKIQPQTAVKLFLEMMQIAYKGQLKVQMKDSWEDDDEDTQEAKVAGGGEVRDDAVHRKEH
jgi:hypothetical protein